MRKIPLFLFLFSACAGKITGVPPVLVWPPPPDEAKIRWVAKYRSIDDIIGPPGWFLRVILGVSVPRYPFLLKPWGVSADSSGRIYVTDTGRGDVLVFDPPGKKVYSIGTRGQFTTALPLGIAVTDGGRVYVSDGVKNLILIFTPEGDYIGAFGREEEFLHPGDLAVDEERGILYVVDVKGHKICLYDMEGRFLKSLGKRGSAPGEFNFPVGVAVDREGNLYVTDTGNFRVQIFDKNGNFINSFGKPGDAFGDFHRPKGIGVDSEGHIYVADAAFGNFQVFDRSGKLLTFVGEPGGEAGKFRLPADLYVDKKDRIYVVDQLNARVQVFQYLGQNSQ